jgi:hypothetical protein
VLDKFPDRRATCAKSAGNGGSLTSANAAPERRKHESDNVILYGSKFRG